MKNGVLGRVFSVFFEPFDKYLFTLLGEGPVFAFSDFL